jgi:2'-5' RNA ligase
MARRRPLPRPELPRFAVAWFPDFPGIERIEAFRLRHDPMAGLIPAHLTLVFPFPTALSRLQVATHVGRVVSGWPPIPATFRRVRTHANEFLFLMAARGAASIAALHDKLYTRSLRQHLRPEFPYEAHITLARYRDVTALEAAEAEAAGAFTAEFDATMREVALLALERDGRIDRVDTFPLNSA